MFLIDSSVSLREPPAEREDVVITTVALEIILPDARMFAEAEKSLAPLAALPSVTKIGSSCLPGAITTGVPSDPHNWFPEESYFTKAIYEVLFGSYSIRSIVAGTFLLFLKKRN